MTNQKLKKNSVKKGNFTKSKIFFACLFLLIIIVIVLFFFLNNRQTAELITLKSNLGIEINSEIKIKDLIAKTNPKINVINEEEVIDTSSFGTKELAVTYQVKNKETKTFPFSVTVLDKTKPIIMGIEDITLTIGTKMDLLENITVTDNSREELEVKLLGEYDFNEIGTYNLKYTASDSNNNVSEINFTLTVDPYKVKHEGLYYWDDRNNEISIIFSGENEAETKTCRKWGENACSSRKGTYQIKGNKITITSTHYKVGYDDPKWLKLSSNSVQTLTIKSIDRLERYSYVYNHMDI